MMRYEDLLPITRDEYFSLFQQPSDAVPGEALLRLAWHEPESKWAERQCVEALSDPREQVRAVAPTALAHLARRQRGLDSSTVARLTTLRRDPDIGGQFEDALDDLAVFSNTSRVD